MVVERYFRMTAQSSSAAPYGDGDGVPYVHCFPIVFALVFFYTACFHVLASGGDKSLDAILTVSILWFPISWTGAGAALIFVAFHREACVWATNVEQSPSWRIAASIGTTLFARGVRFCVMPLVFLMGSTLMLITCFLSGCIKLSLQSLEPVGQSLAWRLGATGKLKENDCSEWAAAGNTSSMIPVCAQILLLLAANPSMFPHLWWSYCLAGLTACLCICITFCILVALLMWLLFQGSVCEICLQLSVAMKS